VPADPPELNWSGNYAYRATRVHRPHTVDEVQELVGAARSIRALGSRHSFTAIVDAGELVALDGLHSEIEVDVAAGTVRLPGGVTYARLAEVLNEHGMALHNLASLPHISVAGAVATASHGSGDDSGNLATAVTGIELVTSTGELLSFASEDPDFDGAVVGLGALGIVTGLTLAVEPYYEASQYVFEGLSWEALFDHFDAVTGAGDSVSVFHRFGEETEQVWVKRRSDRPHPPFGDDLFGAAPARGPRHPIAGMDPANATVQLGLPGPWSERLAHFRSGFTPSSGEEIQSEFFVARADAAAAIDALRGLAEEIRPLLLIAELRTIAADRLWLSPHHSRPSAGLHFTWRRSQPAVERMLGRIEAALAPLAPRPHWGKLFCAEADAIAPGYERMDDFRRLRQRLDPRGAFDSEWLRRHVLGVP
jgi:xylitol oxidase